jgi:hypothetical protein
MRGMVSLVVSPSSSCTWGGVAGGPGIVHGPVWIEDSPGVKLR